MATRSWGKQLLRYIGIAAVCFLVFSIGTVLLMRWVNPVTSAFMLRDRAVALFSGTKDYRFGHEWVDWNAIAIPMKLSVIAAEDQKFPDHYGFDVDSMEKAWAANQRGRRIRGGSTLSQQVAKNLYLWPGRSYVRKGLEAWFTLLIETCWPKRRILEIYLNSAEFGPGVFGVGAASERYFRKPASRLTATDAALLAAVLPNPKRYLVTRPSNYVRSRQTWIVRQMAQLGSATVTEL